MQQNEHICSTALYYYDAENITESRLSFRQQTADNTRGNIIYEQEHHEWLSEVFGCEQNGPTVQYVGDIVTKVKVASSHFRTSSSTVSDHFNCLTSLSPAIGRSWHYSSSTRTSESSRPQMFHASSGSGGHRRFWDTGCFGRSQSRFRMRLYTMLQSFRWGLGRLRSSGWS